MGFFFYFQILKGVYMLIVIFIIGIIIGFILASVLVNKSKGSLNVVNTEDGVYMYLELNEDVDTIKNCRNVSFKVKNDTQK